MVARNDELPHKRLNCWPLNGDVMTWHEMNRLIYLETMKSTRLR